MLQAKYRGGLATVDFESAFCLFLELGTVSCWRPTISDGNTDAQLQHPDQPCASHWIQYDMRLMLPGPRGLSGADPIIVTTMSFGLKTRQEARASPVNSRRLGTMAWLRCQVVGAIPSDRSWLKCRNSKPRGKPLELHGGSEHTSNSNHTQDRRDAVRLVL